MSWTVREFREHLGLSQPALARALDVSERTIQRWEHRGQPSHPVYRKRLAQLARDHYAHLHEHKEHADAR